MLKYKHSSGGGYLKVVSLTVLSLSFAATVGILNIFNLQDIFIPDVSATSADLDVNINLQPFISIQAQGNNIDFELSPSNNNFQSKAVQLTVTSNNITGYKMYIKSSNSYTDLKHTDTTISDAIKAITNNVTSANFPDNSWGYNFGSDPVTASSLYTALTTDETELASKDSPTLGDTYNFTAGIKGGSGLPAGEYSNTVVISAIANPEPTKTISRLTNMQEMNVDSCTASADGETKTLVDSRDNKSYTVKKIGSQCWMTQNLMYNGVGMTAENTDINDTAEPGYTNAAPTAQPDATSGSSDTEPYYYYKTSGWDDSYGYLYNYPAATLNNTQDRTSGTAPNSICPKGWKLPTGGNSTTSDWNILSQTLDGVTGYHSLSNYTNSSTNHDWRTGPWSGVLSGFWYAGFYGQGSSGGWWSSSVNSSNFAYYAGLLSSGVDPGTYNFNRYNGYAVRCVAR